MFVEESREMQATFFFFLEAYSFTRERKIKNQHMFNAEKNDMSGGGPMLKKREMQLDLGCVKWLRFR